MDNDSDNRIINKFRTFRLWEIVLYIVIFLIAFFLLILFLFWFFNNDGWFFLIDSVKSFGLMMKNWWFISLLPALKNLLQNHVDIYQNLASQYPKFFSQDCRGNSPSSGIYYCSLSFWFFYYCSLFIFISGLIIIFDPDTQKIIKNTPKLLRQIRTATTYFVNEFTRRKTMENNSTNTNNKANSGADILGIISLIIGIVGLILNIIFHFSGNIFAIFNVLCIIPPFVVIGLACSIPSILHKGKGSLIGLILSIINLIFCFIGIH